MDAKDAEVAFYVAEADKATKPSLRDDLIEAGMQALVETEAGYDPPHHGIDDLAEACLDAVLDTLADRADEWADSGREFDTISSAGNVTDKGYVFRLIAVLREGDE